jgi:hypothetical protein
MRTNEHSTSPPKEVLTLDDGQNILWELLKNSVKSLMV